MSNPLQKVVEAITRHTTEEVASLRASTDAGLAQTVNALRVTAARPQPLAPNAVNAGRGRLVGWSLKGGAASGDVKLYGARDANDPLTLLAVIPLAAGGGDTKLPASPGISFGDGLFVSCPSDVTGALYFGALD